jgi:hypothetical protein
MNSMSNINKIAEINADVLIRKIAELVPADETDLKSSALETEAVPHEDKKNSAIPKETKMEDIEKKECGTAASLETEAAKPENKKEETENPINEESKPEDKKELDSSDKKDVKPEIGGKKVEIEESKIKEVEDLLKKVLKNEKSEEALGEDEKADIQDLEKIQELLGFSKKDEQVGKTDKLEEGAGDFPLADIPSPAESAEKKPAEVAEKELFAPAAYVASLVKKANIGESLWVIKHANTDEEVCSFSIKAAFGAGIEKDTVRSEFATSADFGKAVVASFIENKVQSALGAQAAVFQVVAHYTPSWPAASKEFNQQTQSEHAKAKGEGDVTTDKNLPKEGTEAKAAVEVPLVKTAGAEGEGTDGKVRSDAVIFPAQSKTEKTNTKEDKSITPHSSEQIPVETDSVVKFAEMEQKLQKIAEENTRLKIEAQLTEKKAVVKECITAMVNKGLLRPNESVRIAALKEGLSLEAAVAKAMAASINEQSKNLLGMNTNQLQSYKKSIAEIKSGVVAKAATDSPLYVKASSADINKAEEDRLLALFGWDK